MSIYVPKNISYKYAKHCPAELNSVIENFNPALSETFRLSKNKKKVKDYILG